MNTAVLESPATAAELTGLEPPPPLPVTARAASAPMAMSVVAYAMQHGATAAEVRELMALQVQADNHQLDMLREKRRMDEEDRKRAAELAFRRDFAAFKAENIVIPKSKYVDRGKAGGFFQAEFGAAMKLLQPALSRHGFGVRHDEVFGWRRVMTDGVESDVPWVFVTVYLEHRDGHAESLKLEGPPGDLSANTPVQNMQVTASYLKRQGTLALTGTATEDEDDENKLGNRRRSGPGRGDESDGAHGASDQQSPDEVRALIDDGQEKATQGMKALTSWWAGLTEKQRATITPEFASMRKAARQFDEGK